MLNKQINNIMKDLFIVTLTICNAKTKEKAEFSYYFQAFSKAVEKLNSMKQKCNNFEYFAGDWKYLTTNIRKERFED